MIICVLIFIEKLSLIKVISSQGHIHFKTSSQWNTLGPNIISLLNNISTSQNIATTSIWKSLSMLSMGRLLTLPKITQKKLIIILKINTPIYEETKIRTLSILLIFLQKLCEFLWFIFFYIKKVIHCCNISFFECPFQL